MINVNELEARWLKYKIKSYIPHIVILLSISIIVAVFTLFNSKSAISNNVVTEAKIENTKKVQVKTIQAEPLQEAPVVEIKEKVKKEIKVKPAIPPVKEIKQKFIQIQPLQEKKAEHISPNYKPTEKTLLSPSLDFMSKLQDNTLPYFDNEAESRVEPTIKEKVVQTKVIHKIEQKKEKVLIEPIKKKSSIQIDRQNTHDDINQVIKRFKRNNNPALSLFIAKKYYQLEEYHQAYNYSLMTNEINNDIEASWIIFAKSLVKLNEKSMAIETLNKYIAYSNSHRAKILLDEITSGKFK